MLNKILYFSHFLESFVKFFGKVGAWLSIPLIFIIIFDVITRRFFVLGSTKLQELEWHLHTAIFLLALGFAYIKNSHVRIEIIRAFIPFGMLLLFLAGLSILLKNISFLVVQTQKDKQKLELFFKKHPEFKDTR